MHSYIHHALHSILFLFPRALAMNCIVSTWELHCLIMVLVTIQHPFEALAGQFTLSGRPWAGASQGVYHGGMHLEAELCKDLCTCTHFQATPQCPRFLMDTPRHLLAQSPGLLHTCHWDRCQRKVRTRRLLSRHSGSCPQVPQRRMSRTLRHVIRRWLSSQFDYLSPCG